MKREILLSYIMIILSGFIFTTYSQTTFQKIYSASAAADEMWDMHQTADGGYIMVGYSGAPAFGFFDVYLLKTDSKGTVQWSKKFGGTNNDYGYSVKQTDDDADGQKDDGYIITGFTGSFTTSTGFGGFDVYLIKTNANGNHVWSKTYGDIGEDEGKCIQQTSDGGYIIAGHTQNIYVSGFDVYVIKTDNSGGIQWANTFDNNNGFPGFSSDDYGTSIRQTNDGGYIVTGFTNADPDVFLIKLGSDGTLKWNKIFYKTATESGNEVIQTSDGGYAVIGFTSSFGAGGGDIMVLKTDSLGTKQWSKAYGGIKSDLAASIKQTADKGYIIGGTTVSYGAGGGPNHGGDACLMKIDSSGAWQWSRAYGGTTDEFGSFVQQANDGGYILAGVTGLFGIGAGQYSNVYLIKTDTIGRTGCNEVCFTPIVTNAAFMTSSGFTQGVLATISIPATLESVAITKDSTLCNFISPATSFLGDDTSVCDGYTVTLKTGFQGTYTWSTGNTTQSINVNSAGQYWVKVISSCDSLVDTLTIALKPIPTLIVSSNDSICLGNSTILTAAGATIYAWHPSQSLNPANSAMVTASPTLTTTYTIIGETNGCTDTAKTKVTVNFPPVLTASDASICVGDSTTLSAAGGMTYLWNNGLTTTSIFVNPAGTTIYNVTAYNYCGADSKNVTVTVYALPAADAGTNTEINPENSITLTATGGTTYIWSPAAGLSCTSCQSPSANPPTTTTYHVKVIDANGCINTDSVIITVLSPSLYFPNSFTPNGDGKNDFFFIYGGDIKTIDISIFDRWGKLITNGSWQSVGNSGVAVWDGKYKGVVVQEDVYICLISCQWNSGGGGTLKEKITVVR